MQDIKISNFEELEYDLSNIGLQGYFFCVEENVKYIYGKNTYIEINDKTSIIEKEKDVYISDKENDSFRL